MQSMLFTTTARIGAMRAAYLTDKSGLPGEISANLFGSTYPAKEFQVKLSFHTSHALKELKIHSVRYL